MGFSKQEYWSGLPFPSPEDLPDPGIKPRSPALQADSLLSEPPGKPTPDLRVPVKFVLKNHLAQEPLVAQTVKSLPEEQETRVQSLGREDPLEKEMAIHSSILAWRIPCREEPGGIQSVGLQRVYMTE